MANRSGDNLYNETGQSFNNNPASLKGNYKHYKYDLYSKHIHKLKIS